MASERRALRRLEAFPGPSEASSSQLGLFGNLHTPFWEPLGPLGAGFWTSPGHHFRSQIQPPAAFTSCSHKTQLPQTYSCTLASLEVFCKQFRRHLGPLELELLAPVSGHLKKKKRNRSPRRPITLPTTHFDFSPFLESLPWRVWKGWSIPNRLLDTSLEAP